MSGCFRAYDFGKARDKSRRQIEAFERREPSDDRKLPGNRQDQRVFSIEGSGIVVADYQPELCLHASVRMSGSPLSS